jgi:hypothetical protein
MKLKLVRKIFLEDRVISNLYIDGVLYCQVLEDTDRGLDSKMSLDEIKKLKIWGKTCIPYGTYEVIISFSNKFQKMLPLLVNVPGYLGIRIHSGVLPEHTEGCLLPGVYNNGEFKNSRIMTTKLISLVEKAKKRSKITIEITKEVTS